jgi:hypothetical protein
MSKPRPAPARRLTCTDLRFAEVDFPRKLGPRLVIQFISGITLLLEDQAAVPLANKSIVSPVTSRLPADSSSPSKDRSPWVFPPMP